MLLASATVREAITTAALLRLPGAMSTAEKRGRAEAVLDLLGLSARADTLIGDDTLGMKGISGGQRRRVSIGIELVRDPSIIFLDEPLSGLDSKVALSLVQFLQEIAGNGRTVAFSYHQPSADVCNILDDALLMNAGRILYRGRMASAVAHVRGLGIEGTPGPITNPADFLLDVADTPETAAVMAARYLGSLPGAKGGGDVESGGDVAELDSAKTLARRQTLMRAGSNAGTELVHRKPLTGHIFQYHVLLQRELRTTWRSRATLAAQLGQAVIGGIIVGVLYWNVPSQTTTANFKRLSALYICLTMIVGGAVTKAVGNWDGKQRLVRRENMTRMYSLHVMWAAMETAQFLVTVGIVVCFSVLYPMVHFQYDFAKYLVFVCIGIMLERSAEHLGMMVRYMLSSGVTYALVNVTLLVCAMLSGFLIPIDTGFLKIAHAADFITYFYNALLLNEFTGVVAVLPDPTTGVPLCVVQWLGTAVTGSLLGDTDPQPAWNATLPYFTDAEGSSAAVTAANAALVFMRHAVSNMVIDPNLDALVRSPDVQPYNWPVRLPSAIDL